MRCWYLRDWRIVASEQGINRAVAALGTLAVGFALAMLVIRDVYPSFINSLMSMVAVFVCLLVVVPACVIFDRRSLFGSGLDFELLLFGAAELAIVVPLCRASTGAWVNYAIQGIVFAAILTGRSLSRAFDLTRLTKALVPLAIAPTVFLGFALRDAYVNSQERRTDRLAVETCLKHLGHPRASELYFAAAPGTTRVFGRADLVFDDWLYPVFESVHLAEPRSSWLRRALADGSVRFVIATSDDPGIEGLPERLGSLGYVPRFQVASLYVWEHVRATRPRS